MSNKVNGISVKWIPFQFQYGAIVSEVGNKGFELCVVFQFQYGAIVSYYCFDRAGRINVFQFQYGAIVSSGEVVLTPFMGGFNSSMVRLWGM